MRTYDKKETRTDDPPDPTGNPISIDDRELMLKNSAVAEAAKRLADAGGSAPDMAYIPRRRGELA